MLELTRGFSVPQAGRLSEQYDMDGQMFTANVHADRIEEVLQHFICIQEDRMYFFLELPAREIGKIDVYYIDGLTDREALVLLMRYGELLINDGISKFGFGVHDGSAEIIRDKYNVVRLWAEDPNSYDGFFEVHQIPHVGKCITAWNTFSQKTPGVARRIKVDGLDVYDLPEVLKDWGIYFAESREEN